METAVLIPVKSFRSAKRRLADWLPVDERERLARWMAERVVRAAAPLPVFVACDDEQVAEWSESLHAHVSWGPGLGLNGAIDHGIDILAGKGIEQVLVVHGDLPLASGLAEVARAGEIVIVPDRHRDGTNLLCRPTSVVLPAQYGAASFGRHLRSALSAGVAVSVRHDARFATDVDTIDDCRHPRVAWLLRAAGFDVGHVS